jgi:hypothetical protein
VAINFIAYYGASPPPSLIENVHRCKKTDIIVRQGKLPKYKCQIHKFWEAELEECLEDHGHTYIIGLAMPSCNSSTL